MMGTQPPTARSRPMGLLLATTLGAAAFAACSGAPDRDPFAISPSRIERITRALTTPVDRPPLHKPPIAHPYYPDYAMRHPRPGMVLLKIDVDAQGRVAAVDVIESTALILESPARQAARQWSFEPARKNGVAVPATIVVPVEFTQGEQRD